jgi:Flp pilus assembly secretin CpaC
MSRPSDCRACIRIFFVAGVAALVFSATANAQNTSATPATTPAGTLAARPSPPSVHTKKPLITEKQAREADDAYLEGAKELERDDLEAAQRSFARAVELNPNKDEYALSLAVAREHQVTELVQAAARARVSGDDAAAQSFLAKARSIDPDNEIVTQHILPDPPQPKFIDPMVLHAKTPSFDGPIELAPTAGTKDIAQHTGIQDVIRAVYKMYGIDVTFDSSVTDNTPLDFNLKNVDFGTATHFLHQLTHTFAVPVQPHSALIAKENQEDRERLAPLIEETVYLPGVTAETMTDMANIARNVFDIKQVTASPTGGDILIRGDEGTLKVLNATYADMLDGGSDVLLDMRIYEVDKSHLVNVGGQLPGYAGVFSLTSELQTIVSQNQALIDQLIAAGTLKLPGGYFANLAAEGLALIASGTVSLPQINNLLGFFGSLGTYTNAAGILTGVPLAGLYLGGASTFNLLLNSSDVRMLDDVEVRSTDGQPVNFRAGTRYPIVTSTYSSGISSALSSQLAGVTVNGQSASKLLSQYLGTGTSTTVPQIQYEDLGITLKTTPHIQRSGNVAMALDLKIEAIGSGSLNGIPVLNNRTFTSTISVPAGQTALLASVLSRNEVRDIEGLPGLSELPGFQGTDKSTELDTGELLITITPHVVRTGQVRVVSRRLALDKAPLAPQ